MNVLGESLFSLSAIEIHLSAIEIHRLNFTGIKDRDSPFLLNILSLPKGLFGDAISAVSNRHQDMKCQSATYREFIPYRNMLHGLSSSCTQPLPRSHRVEKMASFLAQAPSQRLRRILSMPRPKPARKEKTLGLSSPPGGLRRNPDTRVTGFLGASFPG